MGLELRKKQDVKGVFCREKSVITSQRDRVAVTGTRHEALRAAWQGMNGGGTQVGYFGVINGICKMQSC